MKKLTKLQQDYLDICNLYYNKFKKYPTLKELAEHFKCSQGNAYHKLEALGRSGYLK